jgi:hypothetical protein
MTPVPVFLEEVFFFAPLQHEEVDRHCDGDHCDDHPDHPRNPLARLRRPPRGFPALGCGVGEG